jgi:ketosteroid isomerase-like protein
MSAHFETQSTDIDTGPPHAVNQLWCDAFNAGDLPALMATYERDAVIVPGPGAEPLQGHAAIEAALTWFLGLGGMLRFTPRHWLVQGDLALASIAFTMDGGTDADGNAVDLHGVTSEVLRRQTDGTWKYVIDHPFGGSH